MTEYMKKCLSFSELYQNNVSFLQKGDTRSALADIAAGYNMYGGKAIQLADEVIKQVRKYEERYIAVQEDTCKAMRPFFRSLDGYPPQKRVQILDDLVFTLDLLSDEVLLEQAEQEGFEKVFRQEDTPVIYDDSLDNEMFLKDRLLEQMEKRNLSAHGLRDVAKKLKTSPSAAELYEWGLENFRLKCAAAMHLHLRNRMFVSISDAVSFACRDAYMKEAADAVHYGHAMEQSVQRIPRLAPSKQHAGKMTAAACNMACRIKGMAVNGAKALADYTESRWEGRIREKFEQEWIDEKMHSSRVSHMYPEDPFSDL